MDRVEFFIAGVQKGGTTALDTMLRNHPAIRMASVKEVHFFDDDTIDWRAPDYDHLHQAFDWSAPAVRGEATPIYCYWPAALERLQAYNPAAKLIILFRHPALRAWSHWRMETARRAETLSFADAIGSVGRNRVTGAPGGVHRVYSYIERGFYAPQVSAALRLFPRKQILFCRTDRLWSDPAITLAAIQDFLDVPRMLTPERRYIVPMDAPPCAIPSAQRARLSGLFATDIDLTSRMTNLDLGDWHDPAYVEPMRPATPPH